MRPMHDLVTHVGRPCWLSHDTAAYVWGLRTYELVEPVTGTPHVTLPRNASRRLRTQVTLHRVALAQDDMQALHGLPVTSVTRTVADLARTRGLQSALVAADGALGSGVLTSRDLDRLARWRSIGAGLVRRVAQLADGRAESVLESLGRLLVVEAGLAPEVQKPIRVGEQRYRADLVVGDLVIELDGFASHGGLEAFRADRFRDRQLLLAGYRVLRLTWDDVVKHPAATVATVRSLAHGR